jgi:hypothetical protein
MKRTESDEASIRLLRQLLYSSEDLLKQLRDFGDVKPPPFGSTTEARRIEALFPQLSLGNLRRVAGPFPPLLSLPPISRTMPVPIATVASPSPPGPVTLNTPQAPEPVLSPPLAVHSKQPVPAPVEAAQKAVGLQGPAVTSGCKAADSGRSSPQRGLPSLQVGAFSTRERASEAIEHLKGLKATTEIISQKNLFVVRMGPLDMVHANTVIDDLRRLGFPGAFVFGGCSTHRNQLNR